MAHTYFAIVEGVQYYRDARVTRPDAYPNLNSDNELNDIRPSASEEIDAIWEEMFIKGRMLPCRMMDLGLDTVACIEQHYIHERGLSPEQTVDYLTTNYVSTGKLGAKCAQGGFYLSPSTTTSKDERRLAVKT
ncbi:uncharacterized protein BP01DRAFT_386775 [Aspergillus saccharolyticus JOP 1030-1]|uniref:3-hydroxyacyl-CoA dehydrogenase C-terminal domain-containing protein n=1 Tax=Aspergillus saccharolyticus JOP 1030-1 TaxID=1450539 RepID=A0A318ZLG6_9EURO|nr:hypothetical protein BP01DRAFT_386775 [Aspergillus saccharolyticus JOP 1030-1]PYH41088.1 hypothetical protein BP01DRAFT_386775 [Aspergillus saccharolyticus JOP 1030-1]